MIDLTKLRNDVEGNILRDILQSIIQNNQSNYEEIITALSRVVYKDEEQIISALKTFLPNTLSSPDITSEDDLTVKTGENKTLVLDHPVWRDEYPSFLVSAGGAAAPDEIPVTIGGVLRTVRSFDGGNTEERLSGSFEIPHDMVIDSSVTPELHVHWRPATTGLGVVKWFFDWEYSPPEGAPISMTSLSTTEEITEDNQYWHKLTTFGYLPQPSTEYGIGGKIGFNVRRTPADEDDTYTGEVYLEQIALHVPCDTKGSRQIYIK